MSIPVPSPRPKCGHWFALCVLITGPAIAADPIQEVGKTASEWVNTRAETVRIETDWARNRSLLTGTIGGLKERAERLQEQRDHLLASTAEQRAEHADLTARLTQSRDHLKKTEAGLQVLTERVQRLRPQLPPRLADALDLSYRSLAGTEASPSERMQLAMTVLNRCAQFNLAITHGDETLTLPGEAGPKSVEVIYWGLSHGYVLDRAAGKAWLGTPVTGTWTWEPLDGAAAAVAELMAIRRDETDPSLVTVPARLKPASAQ